jgi:hypothetical protein
MKLLAQKGGKQVKKANPIKLGERALAICLFALMVLTVMAGLVEDSSATDLDHGWAVIVGPGNSNAVHTQEAKNLRTYLLDKGWDDEHILYLDYGNVNFRDGEPTKEEFVKAIEYINMVCTDDEVVFIAVMDHAVEGENGEYYLRFGKKLDQYMSDTEFGQCLDSIEHYKAMVIDIAGPYSGGFIPMARENDRLIVTDCDSSEYYKKSEYSFYEALTDPDADLDGDAKVSVEEAHAFMIASMNRSSPQIVDPDPQEDFHMPEY